MRYVSIITKIYLNVDCAVIHQNLEDTLVASCVAPWVNAEPVVLSVFNALADAVDGAMNFSGFSHVSVNTWAVSEEVFVDGEVSNHTTVGKYLLLGGFTICWANSAARHTLGCFVWLVVSRCVAGARVTAESSYSCEWVTWAKSSELNVVMSAHRHGVVVVEIVLAVWTTRDDTCLLKPVTWGGNFSYVALKGEAGRNIVASSGVGNRE